MQDCVERLLIRSVALIAVASYRFLLGKMHPPATSSIYQTSTPDTIRPLPGLRSLIVVAFLKYAGASAAVVGASALGLDYLLAPTLIPRNQSTSVSSLQRVEFSTTARSTTAFTQSSASSTGPELVWESDFANGVNDFQFPGLDTNSFACKQLLLRPWMIFRST